MVITDMPSKTVIDMELRNLGYRIHSRPASGPAVWERGGRLYEQHDSRSAILEPKKRA